MVVPKSMSDDRIGPPARQVRSCGRVYPTRPEAATNGTGCFGPNGPFLGHSGSSLCHPAFQPYLEGMTVHFPFQNSYSALPDSFFARVAPTPVAAPRLVK